MRGRLACERGQALITVLSLAFVVALCAGFLALHGSALAGKGRHQRGADLAAVAGAHAIRDAWPRLFAAPTLRGGRPNPRHLDPPEARALGRGAAIDTARRNGLQLRPGDVRFPESGGFAPTRVEVTVRAPLTVRKAAAGGVRIPARVSATAELSAPAGAGAVDMPGTASGGGYSGPLAYRMGKPMRPDVAQAFDSMNAAARRDGVTLSVNSGFRSDAEQAKLFAARPDPKWVAPPGTSLHRYGTELDLGPPGAYGWLAANARRFGFIHRYAWSYPRFRKIRR